MAPDGRFALVTGGSRGIGLGIADALAREGYDLVINGVRPEDAVQDTLARLTGHGVRVVYARGDVSRTEDRERIVALAEDRFGTPALLVNNAGVAPLRRTDVLEATEESFDRVLGVNLRGPFFLTQRVAHAMITQKERNPAFPALVVNITSISADVASPDRAEYCVSKAGLSMVTRVWAARLAKHGIPVFEVRPGIIRTDMTATVQESHDALIATGNLVEPRWGTPHDVGRAVAMLARGDLPYTTGQPLVIDGGLTLPRL